jgi:hypothetical protein
MPDKTRRDQCKISTKIGAVIGDSDAIVLGDARLVG